jgi:phage tail-like protein
MPDDMVSGFDPYANFRFRLTWDGGHVAGISKVSGLTHATQVISQRAGGDLMPLRRPPGQSEYQAITLERGVTYDIAFEQWASKVWDFTATDDGQGGSLKDLRKDLGLELRNEAGQTVAAYTLRRCWPSEFAALPELDANGNAVAIQLLKLENEGWERVVPPGDELEKVVLPAVE